MERRKPQKLAPSQYSRTRFKAGKSESKSSSSVRIELQTNSWLRISLAAKDTSKKFTNLFCHLTVANLREAFHALDGSKATGISGIRHTLSKLNQNFEEPVALIGHGGFCEGATPLSKERE